MLPTVHFLPGQDQPARRLAACLGLRAESISVRKFPDGESLVRTAYASETAIVYCSLDSPDAKLVQLVFAASALRDCGAKRIVLVAPYMCYMRQDASFAPCEAVSQKVIARLLSASFDRIVTVDPHLHRTRSLPEIFGVQCDQLSAAPLIGAHLGSEAQVADIMLIGPDVESYQWVQSAAAAGGFQFLVGSKNRSGDRQVKIEIPDLEKMDGKTAIIVDDLVSSGTTVCVAAGILKRAGARSVEVFAVHSLASADDASAMRAAGISRLRSTDSVLHESNVLSLAPLLAVALSDEIPDIGGYCD